MLIIYPQIDDDDDDDDGDDDDDDDERSGSRLGTTSQSLPCLMCVNYSSTTSAQSLINSKHNSD